MESDGQMDGGIRTDAPDWQPWLVFFLQLIQQQEARLEKKIQHERLSYQIRIHQYFFSVAAYN
jgi:hypothetical protein